MKGGEGGEEVILSLPLVFLKYCFLAPMRLWH